MVGLSSGLAILLLSYTSARSQIDFYEQRIRDSPTSSVGYYELALVHHGKGNLEAAERNFKTALKLDPRNRRYIDALSNIKGEIEEFGGVSEIQKLRHVPWKSSGEPRIAVVVPFNLKDVGGIARNFYLWNDTRRRACPCGDDCSSPFELVFQFNRNIDDHPRLKTEILNLFSSTQSLRHCFSRLHFLSANLSDAEDHYACAGWDDSTVSLPTPAEPDCSGPSVMFYKLFDGGVMSRFSYFHLLESDVYPIKSDWLSDIFLEVAEGRRENFWVRGAMSKVCEKCKGLALMNGNALYKLGDPDFNLHLKNVHHLYWGHSYDAAIGLYLRDPDNAYHTSLIIHKFQFNTLVNDEYVMFALSNEHHFPNSAFVHISGGWKRPVCRVDTHNLTGGTKVSCGPEVDLLFDLKSRRYKNK